MEVQIASSNATTYSMQQITAPLVPENHEDTQGEIGAARPWIVGVVLLVMVSIVVGLGGQFPNSCLRRKR